MFWLSVVVFSIHPATVVLNHAIQIMGRGVLIITALPSCPDHNHTRELSIGNAGKYI